MYSDLDRPPLRQRELAALLSRDAGLWREIRVLAEVDSTNAVVAAQARAGAPEGLVVVAEAQTAGRGRLARGWMSPPRAGLLFSVLLRPGPAVPAPRFGLLPLLAGVALVRAVQRHADVEARLKWPNDLLLGPGRRKAAGILAELVGAGPDAAVVVGIGLNVSTRLDELPVPDATSLLVEGATALDRGPLLHAVLRALGGDYVDWWNRGGDPRPALLPAYRAVCDTIGRRVRVQRCDATPGEGTAVDVDDEGRLVVVDAAGGRRAWSAGNVLHLR